MRVIVIGAGASGLICSAILAERGYETIVLEKNEKIGKKLYITGKGRCNVTNNCSCQDFLLNVVNNAKFLYGSIYSFTPQNTIDLIQNNGTMLKTERGNRVFPVSDKSSDIIKSLHTNAIKCGVIIKYNQDVVSVTKNAYFTVKTKTDEFSCDRVVVCTGGVSYKATGSTGLGYEIAKSFGHKIVATKPALCPIKLKDSWVKNIEGLSLKNVQLYAEQNGKIIKQEFGEMLFTKDGISGPIVLTMSSYINKCSNVNLYLDFKPALTVEKLENRVLREIDNNKNCQITTILKTLLPMKLVPIFIEVANLNGNLKANSITVGIRKKIVENLKHFSLKFDRLYDIDYAIITSGGVSVNEINPKTMESKLVAGLYFSGEVLDVDALTGGFNIQIALSTGYSAGKGVK